MKRRYVRAAAALFALSLATAACSSSDGGSEAAPSSFASTSTAETPVETQPAPSTSTPVADPLHSVCSIDYESHGGYTWTVTPKFGKVRSVTDPSVNQSLVEACGADPQTAGFIPTEVTTENTSTFTEDTAFGFLLADSSKVSNVPDGLQWVANLSTGPDCQLATSSEAGTWTVNRKGMAPGATGTTRGGILISNWKSPDYPRRQPRLQRPLAWTADRLEAVHG